MSNLQNQGDEDASVISRQGLPSLHDEDVVKRLNKSFNFYNEDGHLLEVRSKKKREFLEKVTVTTPRSSEDIHLLQALPNLEEVTLNPCGNIGDENLASVLIRILALANVQRLRIDTFESLTSVPPEIGQLIQLQSLAIHFCNSLTSVPPEIGQLVKLQTLSIHWCHSITSVPPEIGQLVHLQTLRITRCRSLTSVPPEIGQLINLLKLIVSFEVLPSVSSVFGQLTNLEKLEITNHESEYGSSIPISPILLEALPHQCSIAIVGKMSCHAKGCDISVAYNYGKDKTVFKRHEINVYFEWLRNFPIGASKLQILANRARQRAATTIYSPGGPKYKHLKMSWEEMQQGDH